MNSVIGNISAVSENSSRGSSLKIEKVMRCAKCLNHGELVPVKDHKNYCPWKECQCDKCSLIDERRRIMAAQVALRRKQCIEERLKAKSKNNNNSSNSNMFETSDAQQLKTNENKEKLDEDSRKYLLKSCEQLMTELYSSLGSEVSNEEVLVSALYALLKEKQNAYLALSSIRGAFEELNELRESLQQTNGKQIKRTKSTTDEAKDKKVSTTSEKSTSSCAPELAHMQLSNYYYYQRMSPYYRKLYNLPANTSVYPFPVQSTDSVLHNFLADNGLNSAQHLIARNNAAINVSHMRQSTGQTTN